ncbi:MAG: tannase/feruloyl esterase family alpha/beta hydrolase [Candidatus Acidiferrales bacterium]|jgi:feruloyl esterase
MTNHVRRNILTMALIIAYAALAHAPHALAQTAATVGAVGERCSLARLEAMAPPDTTITEVSLVAATQNVPEYCRVDAYVATPGNSVPFRLGLPAAWNEKFLFVGVGGFAGTIPSIDSGLLRGYATAGTDTGHQAKASTDATWAYHNLPKEIDYGYRGTHVTAVAAKLITEKFYGERPREAYFDGCSNGGRQALMEVQRYPADFNGVIAGDPSFLLDGQLNRIWGYQALLSDADHYIPAAKLSLLSSAITAECDGKDGLVDGLIDDPRACGFDAATLLCKSGDAATCLTAGQVDSFTKLTAGPADAAGKQIVPGFTLGDEDGPGGWDQWVVGTSATQPDGEGFNYMTNFLRYLAFPDNQNPNYDYRTFNFATDLPLLAKATQILRPGDPNLNPFRTMGGKLLMYHGWADPALSPLTTIDYFDDVVAASGGEKAADSFVRFFTVPGMHHCSGGPGPNTFDTLSALEQWVERSAAPDKIIATHRTNGVADRTRPLCPYPQVARYTGTGSDDDAANFVCKMPAPTKPAN